jgi:hypothetical protein
MNFIVVCKKFNATSINNTVWSFPTARPKIIENAQNIKLINKTQI